MEKSFECDDAISREDAIIAINKSYEECEEWRALSDLQYGKNQGLSLAITVIEDLPSVTQKSGKWVRVTDKTGHLVWECDKCGWQQRFNTNFCPDCGCRMVEPQESEE